MDTSEWSAAICLVVRIEVCDENFNFQEALFESFIEILKWNYCQKTLEN